MPVTRAEELDIDRSDSGVAAMRLVNSQQGATTMTAGVSIFEPGAAILLHTHPCEETVIILDGTAVAYVDGERFDLNRYDTTIMPPGVPHRFVNESDKPMTIAYFYPLVDAPRYPVDGKESQL